jgi:hypothetical protein
LHGGSCNFPRRGVHPTGGMGQIGAGFAPAQIDIYG